MSIHAVAIFLCFRSHSQIRGEKYLQQTISHRHLCALLQLLFSSLSLAIRNSNWPEWLERQEAEEGQQNTTTSGHVI